MPNTVETRGQLPDPADFLQTLNGFSTDQKKYNHLRDLFLEEADVDECINHLETDEEIDLNSKQISQLKASLTGYKVYLKEYLEQTGERIGRFDERLKKNTEEYANPDLAPEEVEALALTRKRVAKAMQIAKVPRGPKGKSLKEVTASGVETKKELSPEQKAELLMTVKVRFEANMSRHQGIEWAKVEAKLEASPEKMWSLNEMERTGGEPDVVGFDKKTGEYIFIDCSAESPEGRRMICYDREGQELAEKYNNMPKGNAIDMAKAMGIDVLTEAEYQELQKLGTFDSNTWSWLKTPIDIRKNGRALYGSRDYDRVNVHQGFANNHVAHRSFRGSLRV